jgi:hypothetical protein
VNHGWEGKLRKNEKRQGENKKEEKETTKKKLDG